MSGLFNLNRKLFMKDKREESELEGIPPESGLQAIRPLRHKCVESNSSVTGRRIGHSVNLLTNGESSNSGIFLKNLLYA